MAGMHSSYHIGEPSLISKLLLPCVYYDTTREMQSINGASFRMLGSSFEIIAFKIMKL